MPELAFQIRGAQPLSASAVSAVALQLELTVTPPSQTIQSVMLNCQIRIEAARRRYATAEQGPLRDLFGEPERWGQTLRPLLWTNLTTTVPAFTSSVCIPLVVPCSFDLDETAAKYFHGVNDGAVPVSLAFSGTIFYRSDRNELQAAPIPWNAEARFAFPIPVWKECIARSHPNTAWLPLRRDLYERLYEFKVRHGLATFDEAVERMIVDRLEVEA